MFVNIILWINNKALGGNSQNFLSKFVIFFVTLRCSYGVAIHRKYDLYSTCS